MSPATLPWGQWLFYVACRWGFRILFRLLGGLRVEGLEHLPCRGPVILAPNHRSLLDPWLMCAACPNPLRSLAAEDLFQVAGLGWFLRAMGAFPLRRGQADPEAMSRALELLRRGATLMIFPEGRISPNGHPQPWLPGVAWISLRSQVAVIPVHIEGSGRVLPLGRYWPGRGPMVVRFLPPQTPPVLERRNLRHQVEAWLSQLECRALRDGEADDESPNTPAETPSNWKDRGDRAALAE